MLEKYLDTLVVIVQLFLSRHFLERAYTLSYFCKDPGPPSLVIALNMCPVLATWNIRPKNSSFSEDGCSK